jgi:hypothetical protein
MGQILRSPMNASIKNLDPNSVLYSSPQPIQQISVSPQGTLVNEFGTRQKFIGGRLVNTACFPDSVQAIEIANRMHSLGFNAVRLINFDFPFWDAISILKPLSTQLSDGLNPDQMKKFDWFVYQLHQKGIHVHLTFFTLFSPRINDNAGLTQNELNWSTLGRILNYIDSDYQRVQKQILSLFFQHTNPYLQTTYANYKGILAVDLMDRNSMLQYAVDRHLHPQSQGGTGLYAAKYTSKIDTLFNQYLQKKYTTDQNRIAAWRAISPDTSNTLSNASFEDPFSSVWNFNASEGATALPEYSETNKTDGDLGFRVRIQTPGSEFWYLQLYQTFPKIDKYKRYRVTFDAKTSVPSRNVFVQIHNSEAPYQNYGFALYSNLTDNWKTFSYEFRATESDVNPRLMFGLGVEMGDFFVDKVSIREISDPPLPQNESIQNLSVKRAIINDPNINQGIIADNMGFYTQLMENYNTSMYRFLKDTLNVKALIGSNQELISLNDVYAVRNMDFTQSFSGWDWRRRISDSGPDSVWRIDNNPMLSVTWGGNIGNVARSNIKNKPMFLSSIGMPFPSSSLHELVTVWPTYAAFQDWDVVYLENLTDDISILNNPSYIKNNHYSHWNNTSLLSFVQQMKVLFVKQGVSRGKSTLEIPQTVKALENPIIDQRGMYWLNGQADGRIPLYRRTVLAGFDNQEQSYRPQEQIAQLSNDFGVDLSKIVTDTEEINWNAIDTTFTVNSPYVKLATGRVTSKIFSLDDVQVTFLDPLGYGTFSMVTLEKESLKKSNSTLITLGSRTSHSNSIWENANTVWKNWGDGAVVSEALSVLVRIDSDYDSLVVNVLDEQGMPKRSFPAERISKNRFRVQIDQKQDASHWFHIQGIQIASSVANEQTANIIDVFPHPVQSVSTIQIPFETNSGARSIVLKDILGNAVITYSAEMGVSEQTVLLDAAQLSNGVYYLQVNEGNTVRTTKVLIQK